MKGLIVRSGPYWGRASGEYAAKRLAHRGFGAPAARWGGFELRWSQDAPAPQTAPGVQLWSFGMPAGQEGAALEAAVQGRLEKDGPSRWMDAFHVLIDERTKRLSIVRGEFDETPVRWCARSGSLFVAPECKAFTNLKDPGKVRELAPGCSLVYPAESGEARVVDGWVRWPRPSLDTRTFEEACSALVELTETWLAERLPKAAPPLAVALSGGLDSAIAASIAVKLGYRPPAYTVWFDLGDGTEPNDLLKARRHAAELGLEHREIRVTQAEIPEYLDDMVLRGESMAILVIEGSLHWLILARRMAKDGIRTCISGQGSDHLLASFPEILSVKEGVDPYDQWFENVRTVVSADRERLVTDSYGLTTLGAYQSPEFRDFALTLPIEYLWHTVDGRIQGKRILRAAFADRLPPSFTAESKVNLHLVGNLGVMLRNLYGPEGERKNRYPERFGDLLAPRRISRWAQWQRALFPGR